MCRTSCSPALRRPFRAKRDGPVHRLDARAATGAGPARFADAERSRSGRAREVPRALSLIKPLEREVGRDIGAPGAGSSARHRRVAHIANRRPRTSRSCSSGPRRGTCRYCSRPEGRYPAVRPATPDASEVVRAVPVQSGGEAARTGHVRDCLVKLRVARQKGAKPAKAVLRQRMFSEARNLPFEHVRPLALLLKSGPHVGGGMTHRHRDEPPDPVRPSEAPRPTGQRAPVVTNDVHRLGHVERVE
jgi:hypothetical protein